MSEIAALAKGPLFFCAEETEDVYYAQILALQTEMRIETMYLPFKDAFRRISKESKKASESADRVRSMWRAATRRAVPEKRFRTFDEMASHYGFRDADIARIASAYHKEALAYYAGSAGFLLFSWYQILNSAILSSASCVCVAIMLFIAGFFRMLRRDMFTRRSFSRSDFMSRPGKWFC